MYSNCSKITPGLGHGQVSSTFTHPVGFRYVRGTWQPLGYVFVHKTGEEKVKRVSDRVTDLS